MYQPTLFRNTVHAQKEKQSAKHLPQIDVDNFDPEKMALALRDYGTYELVGESIENLRELGNITISTAKKVLGLYDKVSTAKKLKDVSAANFNGFQDVRAESESRVLQGMEPLVRNQIAFHFKPYEKVSKIPEGLDSEVRNTFNKYYKEAEAILHKHYKDIASHFIADEYRSDLSFNETQEKTVLMMRRYFSPEFVQNVDVENDARKEVGKTESNTISRTTGIPSHSDHGLLTLVTSDEPGLEVYVNDRWLPANYDLNKLNFFINFGDWALFQILSSAKKYPEKYPNNFKEGLHRVPHLNCERYSLILAVNPHKDEIRPTPKGGEVTYQSFLQGKKSDFRDTSRDESANYLVKQMECLASTNKFPIHILLPDLYVVESVDFGQESWKFVKGKGESLCERSCENIPQKAYEGFSYAYSSLDDALEPKKLPKSQGNDLRVLKVTLKYADDIFVVDETLGARLEGSDARKAIAKTLVSLKDYKGDFEKPVYLIQRGLQGGKEADDITSECQQRMSNG